MIPQLRVLLKVLDLPAALVAIQDVFLLRLAAPTAIAFFCAI
jgi:hypothetical protein